MHTRSCAILKKAKCLSQPLESLEICPLIVGKGRVGLEPPFLFAKHQYLTQGAQDNSLSVYWELKLGSGGSSLLGLPGGSPHSPLLVPLPTKSTFSPRVTGSTSWLPEDPTVNEFKSCAEDPGPTLLAPSGSLLGEIYQGAAAGSCRQQAGEP